MQQRGGNRNGGRSKFPVVAALDIGSTKICCMIAEVASRPGKERGDPRSGLKVIGFGQTLSRGVRAVLGVDMPVFEKRRFQHGSVAAARVDELFPRNEARYRGHFETLYARPA